MIPRRVRLPALVTLRLATWDDHEAVWQWNNAPDVRARSHDPRPIDYDGHCDWFVRRLADRLARVFIVEADDVAVGVIRTQRVTPGGAGRISIALDQAARGRGLGRAAIQALCDVDPGPLEAEILADNRTSRIAFEAAGFRLTRTVLAADGRLTLVYLWRIADVAVA